MQLKGNGIIVNLENITREDHLGDLDVDGKIIECTLGKESGKVWTGCIWLRIETSGRLLQGCIKTGDFLIS